MTVLEPMIKLRPHLASLIIDLHFRITRAAREVKNGPSKGEKTLSVQFFLLKRFTGDKEHIIVKKL